MADFANTPILGFGMATPAQWATYSFGDGTGENTGLLNRLFDPQGAQEKYNAYQASIEREFNANEAQKQRDYETEMSNTAYQRAVSDMRAAGLNPNLFYASGGAGASTPAGSAATASGGARSSQGQNMIGVIANLATSAFSLGLKAR